MRVRSKSTNCKNRNMSMEEAREFSILIPIVDIKE